jgi:hypothetical protein
MTKKTLFLASSSELKADREAFEIFINRKNKLWHDKKLFLELILWEDFLDAVSQTRLQDEYNKAIQACDIFVMLFATKVGQYTAEEFETAFGQFKATHKPFIFVYFKEEPPGTSHTSSKDLKSLHAFQQKLHTLGHFCTVYKNSEDLLLKFNQQLDKLAATGFLELKPNSPTPFQQPRLWLAVILVGFIVLGGIGAWLWTESHPTTSPKVEASSGGVAAGRDIQGNTITIHGAQGASREIKERD